MPPSKQVPRYPRCWCGAICLPEIPASLLAQAGLDQVGESTVAVGICDVETLEYASSLGGGVDVIFMCPRAGVESGRSGQWHMVSHSF
jgi:hypothetical protein